MNNTQLFPLTTVIELTGKIHAVNLRWWHDPITKQPLERNPGEVLMLVITELAEACEGARKDLMDDHLPHRKMEEVEMADAMIRLLDYAAHVFTTEDLPKFLEAISVKAQRLATLPMPDNKGEALLHICLATGTVFAMLRQQNGKEFIHHLSNAIGMIAIYCHTHKYDLWATVAEKNEYNSKRLDHTDEARIAEGGKKW